MLVFTVDHPRRIDRVINFFGDRRLGATAVIPRPAIVPQARVMKLLGALVVALALALSAQAAHAHIVQFVTAVPVTAVNGVQDEVAMSKIILTAVKNGLQQAVAFTPTLVVIEDARVVDGQLYLRVIAADSEGETLMQELENARAAVQRRDVM